MIKWWNGVIWGTVVEIKRSHCVMFSATKCCRSFGVSNCLNEEVTWFPLILISDWWLSGHMAVARNAIFSLHNMRFSGCSSRFWGASAKREQPKSALKPAWAPAMHATQFLRWMTKSTWRPPASRCSNAVYVTWYFSFVPRVFFAKM